jgi:hypothetical protein
MISEVTATIISALIGGVFGLVGVWVGFYFSKRASEGDHHAELQYTIYKKIEIIKNLLMAFNKKMISQELLHERWNRVTEEVLIAVIRSGLSKDEKKRVLRAINGKWENPESIKTLQQLADDLLKKLDPEFADAASEILDEFGIKPEDINPVVG